MNMRLYHSHISFGEAAVYDWDPETVAGFRVLDSGWQAMPLGYRRVRIPLKEYSAKTWLQVLENLAKDIPTRGSVGIVTRSVMVIAPQSDHETCCCHIGVLHHLSETLEWGWTECQDLAEIQVHAGMV